MTVAEARRIAEAALKAAGVHAPKLEAELLVAHVLGTERVFVHAHPQKDLDSSAFQALLDRRATRHEPLAYILGWREFYGRKFSVKSGVLVPRQETEILVAAALEAIDRHSLKQVLDFGCGSGCVGVTLKLERPSVAVTLVDVSEAATEVSRENAANLGADVRVILADGFDLLRDPAFDLIVSNPPYIGTSEILPAEIRAHEPGEALFGGSDGLDYYRGLHKRLREGAQFYLELWVEVGFGQARAVKDLFVVSDWAFLGSVADMSGCERVLGFRLANLEMA